DNIDRGPNEHTSTPTTNEGEDNSENCPSPVLAYNYEMNAPSSTPTLTMTSDKDKEDNAVSPRWRTTTR
ncbi:hypothetical protein BBJ28_00013616, partial [Nothophytophthora sp. Chile5]